MLLMIIFLICVFVAAGTGLLAAWSDIKGMTIPNRYSVIIIASFIFCYAFLWLFGRADMFSSALSHLLSFLIVFGLTLAMFAARAIGAADSKLASAYALWVGLKGLMPFLFYMSCFGGLMAIFALIVQKAKPFKNVAEKSWIGRIQAGESAVAYGVAIVFGALASFVNIGYISLDVLASFLLR